MMTAKRKRSIEGVLFDWDGTLINSYRADASAYLAMFKELEISWGIEELEKNYSPNWYEVYRAAGLPRRRWADADRAWRAHYAKHRPKLIAGARRVLANLGGAHPLGLVTSGDRLQRRYSAQETSSGPAAHGHAADEAGSLRVRLCRRRATGCGDGPARRRACDWRARPLPHGKASARGPSGVSDRLDRGIAGRSEEITPLMDRSS